MASLGYFQIADHMLLTDGLAGKEHRMRRIFNQSLFVPLVLFVTCAVAFGQQQRVENWKTEWPRTDFSKSSIAFYEIIEGGPAKDGIPAITAPLFKSADEIRDIGPKEPVISLEINGDARTYPVRILMFHEIVNDTVGGIPVAITYCPLCNAALVFERRLEGRLLEFGTTGKLRKSDMVMYDRQSESWWQQFTGEGIVGKYTGKTLRTIPSRIESFALFRERHPQGRVLVPKNPNIRRYGLNPYVRYDSEGWPFLFRGDYDGVVPPLARVVAVGEEAWPLSLVQKHKMLTHNGLLLRWRAGQNSALDSEIIKKAKDIGTVTVTRNGENVVYHLPFAFAFKAFYPDGIIHTEAMREN